MPARGHANWGGIRADGTELKAFRFLPAVALGLDLTLLTFIATGLLIVSQWLPGTFGDAVAGGATDIALPVVLVLWIASLGISGCYDANLIASGARDYRPVLSASFATIGTLAIFSQFAGIQTSVFIYAYVAVAGTGAVLFGRAMMTSAVRKAHQRGALLKSVIIVGSPSQIDEFAIVLRRESWLGYRVIGGITPQINSRSETHSGIAILGASPQLLEVTLASDADTVFLANGAAESASDLRRLIWELEDSDISIVVAPSVMDVSSDRVKMRPMAGVPLLHIEQPRTAVAARWGKRVFDIVVASCLMLFIAPLLIYCAVRIRMHDRGPIFTRQLRVGRDGKTFVALKFRTLRANSDELLHTLTAEPVGPLFHLEDDPRITRPGRWLRRFSLDELPQLINVLKGDMSLVGPNPPSPHEVEAYDDDVIRRLRVRPGMTGLWQVSGGYALSWTEAVRLDLYYVDNWSLFTDVRILWRTISKVVGGHGIY